MTARKSTKDRPPEQVTLAQRRFYRLADGTELPSVTTILGVALNKPALPGWAAKVVATEAIDNLPRLVRMCRADRDEALRWLKGSPYSQRDAAADLGTRLHDIAEAYVLEKPYTVPDDDSDLGGMLRQFVRFLADFTPTFAATEAVVVNRTVGWAGTLDAICRIPALGDRLLVVDWKTGRSGPFPEWACQVVGYARAEELWLPDGTSTPMPNIEGAAVLRVRPDMYALHEVTGDLDAIYDALCAAVRLAEWAQKAHKESPFGGKVNPAPTLAPAVPA